MKYITIILLAILLATPTQVFAASENCAAIENARERLACFDRLFPREEGATPLPEIRSEVIRPPETLGQPATSTEPAAPRSSGVPVQGQRRSDADDDRGERRSILDRALFEWEADIDFSATIVAIKAEESKRMVFRLDNDEIWMQTSPRYLPFKKGDSVNIKSGTVGGYIMRNENKISTRVKRIQ